MPPFDERRNVERSEKVLQPRRNPFSPPLAPISRPWSAEAEQVLGLDIVELQDPGERFQNLQGRVVVTAALESEIVVGTDPGEQGNFFTAETRHTTVRTCRDTNLLGRHQATARAQVFTEPILRAVIHAEHDSCAGRTPEGSCRSPDHQGPSGSLPRAGGFRSTSRRRKEALTMDISNRTVLIVGGTSGIGLGLARRFADAGSTVIVGGRNTDKVEDLDTVQIDVTDPISVSRARDEVLAKHPNLDTVVTMSGVMVTEDLRDSAHFSQAETTIHVNLLGTIRVIDAFTPHLIGRGSGDIVTVSSGIGFLPFPLMPTYGASKVGVHAYTASLRAHLAGTGVQVTELIPPAVANAGQEKLNPAALPLGDFLDEVMALITENPTPNEVIVKAAERLRWAERNGTYAELLEQRSQSLNTLPGR